MTDDSTSLIDVRNVSWRAGTRMILRNISWRIDPGQRWAMLGPNGVGKTTLLKLVCGYLWPNAGGEILRNGIALTDLRELRTHVGWVSTDFADNIPPEQTVLETVLAGKFAQTRLWEYDRNVIDSSDRDRAEHFLAQMQCDRAGHQAFGTLSQGETQRVLIARAWMADLTLMILDEPCAGLDPGGRERLLSALQTLADEQTGTAMVYVTHHIEEIMPAFESTLVLSAGRVTRSGKTRDVLTPELMHELYGIDTTIARESGRYWMRCR